MAVTNDIQDDVVLNDGIWEVKHKSRDDVAVELEKASNSRKTFLMYQWGVWITAYARNALWKFISIVKDDVVYCDTDSIKMVNSENYVEFFDRENKSLIKRTMDMIKERGLNVTYPPKDINGKVHYMGVFEHEDEYPVKEFKTLGAKKYAYVDNNGELHITLSGVAKSAAKTLVNGLDDFSVGHIFSEEDSGRKIAWYINDMKKVEFVDYFGNLQTIDDQKYGICIEKSTYEIGIAPDYTELLEDSTRLEYLSRINYRLSPDVGSRKE